MRYIENHEQFFFELKYTSSERTPASIHVRWHFFKAVHLQLQHIAHRIDHQGKQLMLIIDHHHHDVFGVGVGVHP